MTVRVALVSLLVSMLLLGGVVSYLASTDRSIGLDSFQTQAEFHAYLRALQRVDPSARGEQWSLGGPFSDVASAEGTQGAEGGFSGTNVQVAGVDEADIVKTDGEFLYLATGGEVVLVRAHPPASAAILSRIRVAEFVGDGDGEAWILGLFLYEDTLVVISSAWSGGGGPHILPASEFPMPILESRTVVSLFSVADPSEPTLLRVLELTGMHQASRLKGGIVYLVLSQATWIQENETSYPMICVDGRCAPYDANRIFYDTEAPEAGSLTNVVAVDLDSNEVGTLAVLTGFASTTYMSLNNLYVTFAKWGRVGGAFPRSDLIASQTGFTSIYRIAIAGTDLAPAAGGDVEGWLLNQFSLDEHQGYLRVATTTWESAPENNVYVLDSDLRVIGALEGLAPGESIYSARFVAEFGYLVTFQKVDPFFVLDLSNPTRPEVLGYLKIPGFSQYLHPMDETHILGVGMDTIEDPSGTFAWFQGLKLSLFDVSDFRAPKEVAKFLVGDRGSSSPVLHDHKAFLYVERDGLVVLPVDLLETGEPPVVGPDMPPWEYGSESWQGALVLSVDAVSGFELEARITHLPPDEAPCPYASGPYGVTRSLYIGAYLYTISPTVLKAHAMDGFAEVSSLVYGAPSGNGGC